MADWTFTPEYTYRHNLEGEKTFINRLEDFSEIRAEKGPTLGGTYRETYTASATELDAMMTFFNARRLTTSFTKLTYDPVGVGFDPDDPASATGPEETVRFDAFPQWTHPAYDVYKVTFTFRILPNE